MKKISFDVHVFFVESSRKNKRLYFSTVARIPVEDFHVVIWYKQNKASSNYLH